MELQRILKKILYANINLKQRGALFALSLFTSAIVFSYAESASCRNMPMSAIISVFISIPSLFLYIAAFSQIKKYILILTPCLVFYYMYADFVRERLFVDFEMYGFLTILLGVTMQFAMIFIFFKD